MNYRTLFFVLAAVALSPGLAVAQSRPASDARAHVSAPTKVAEATSESASEDEEKVIALEGTDPDTDSTARVSDERFNVKQEFGPVQQQRTRWMAPESIQERKYSRTADDSNSGQGGPTREHDGKTDKSEAARARRKCAAVDTGSATAAGNASAATQGAAAATAAGCTN